MGCLWVLIGARARQSGEGKRQSLLPRWIVILGPTPLQAFPDASFCWGRGQRASASRHDAVRGGWARAGTPLQEPEEEIAATQHIPPEPAEASANSGRGEPETASMTGMRAVWIIEVRTRRGQKVTRLGAVTEAVEVRVDGAKGGRLNSPTGPTGPRCSTARGPASPSHERGDCGQLGAVRTRGPWCTSLARCWSAGCQG